MRHSARVQTMPQTLEQVTVTGMVAVKCLPHYLVGGFNHLEKYESQWEG
jgi:hypothetical protein